MAMIACRLMGHRYRFRTRGSVLTWHCGRCGAPGGAKMYADPDDARAYAAAFDREDAADLGRRAPLLGMFPLRAGRALRRRARG